MSRALDCSTTPSPRLRYAAGTAAIATVLAGMPAPGLAASSSLNVIYQNPSSLTFAYDLQAVQPVAYGGLIVASATGGVAGDGEVFLLTPGKAGQPWTKTVIYDFTGSASSNPADGNYPDTLAPDASGNIWGLTEYAGTNGTGIVFELIKPATKTGSWTYRAVGPLPASFTYNGGTNTKSHYASALLDSSGNLDILAQTNSLFCGSTCGVLFQIPATTLVNGTSPINTLYNFSSAATGGGGGVAPQGLVRSKEGDFFGVYYTGGNVASAGFVWELTAKKGVYSETVLYGFCQLANCADGEGPSAVAIKGNNTLYGTFEYGGNPPSGAGGAAGGTYMLTKGKTSWAYSTLYTLYGSNPDGSPTPDHDVQTPENILLSKTGALVAMVQRGGDTINSGGILCEREGGVVAFNLTGTSDSNLSNGFASEGGDCPDSDASSGPKINLSNLAEGSPGVIYGSAIYLHNGGQGTDSPNVIFQIK